MSADRIQIVTAADAKYIVPLLVLAKSLAVNLGEGASAVLHVIDGGLGRRNRRLLERTLGAERVDVRWVSPPPREWFNGVPVFGHVNVSTYYRIAVPRLFPDLKKAIYMDADMLMLGSAADLWRMPMEGRPLMAVQDNNSSTAESARLPGYRELGIAPDAKVFNGGLLVMDLEQWRAGGIAEQILDYSRKYAREIRYWDQDGINAALAGRWVVLPYAWNWRVDCGMPGKSTGLDPEHPERQAGVLHFCSATKPWHYYCEHPLRATFFAYLDRTPLSGWRPRPPLKALMNRHFWGARLRSLPLVGRVWSALRTGAGGSSS